jgi:hypothetical protein
MWREPRAVAVPGKVTMISSGRIQAETQSGACIARAARLGNAVMQSPHETKLSAFMHILECLFMLRSELKSLLRQTGHMCRLTS